MSVVVSVLCVVVADAAVELYPFAFPAGAVGGIADRSATLLDRTIDARGFVSAVGGRFVAGGEEIRFFGVNLTGQSPCGRAAGTSPRVGNFNAGRGDRPECR